MRVIPYVDHTFVICDPQKEPERFLYLQTWFRTQDIDPSCYTIGVSCYGSCLTVEEAYRVYNPWQTRTPVEKERNFNSYNLKLSEISLVMNWIHNANVAIQKGYERVMMLESDVLFEENFLEKLEKVLAILGSQQFDFLSISARDDLRPSRVPGDTSYQWFRNPGYYHTRTTDAMIFQVSMLRKIVGTILPFAEVLDWELNYQLALQASRSLWLDPPIVRQGSGNEYPTTLV